MLTPDEIRHIVAQRLFLARGNCNRTYVDHLDGVLRGLIWALRGEDPGTYLTTDTLHVLDLVGIPASRLSDGTVQIEESHGR